MTTNPSFGATTSGLEVASTYTSNCKSKNILITGVSKDGIGEATARAFAHGGASLVVITGRDDTRLSTIKAELQADYPHTTFLPHKLDLNTIAGSRESAQALLANNDIGKIDILVANAAILGTTKRLTPDGLEENFGVNHVGHFVFVNTLLPKLARPSRIVVVSSLALLVSPIRFHDINFDDGAKIPDDEQPNWAILKHLMNIDPQDGYNAHVAYGQSKTANALFAVHLNRVLSAEGINAFALHPGGVQSRGAKGLLEGKTQEEIEAMAVQFDKSIDQGSATTMVAALDPGLSPEKGVFLNDCQVHRDIPDYAVSAEAADKLWALSEKIVSEKTIGVDG